MQTRGIDPQELLPVGTRVYVKSMMGLVVSAEMEKDQFGGPICVHVIRYTNKLVDKYRKIWRQIDRTSRCNYSAIRVEVQRSDEAVA